MLGRVVYDRPKHLMGAKDAARILRKVNLGALDITKLLELLEISFALYIRILRVVLFDRYPDFGGVWAIAYQLLSFMQTVLEGAARISEGLVTSIKQLLGIPPPSL
jgi:hypothetical protein